MPTPDYSEVDYLSCQDFDIYQEIFLSFFQEFIRVGYYVSNEYNDPELQETPPEQPAFDKLTRNILASNPRVTKFKINWDNPNSQQNEIIELD